MEDIGHSRLLKFFVKGKIMSDTDKKDNDTNIESKVPGEQEVRGVTASETNISQAEGTSETDFHYEPVITVTKKEASFAKGDLKLQKISVTEDISDKTKNETIINEVQIITDKDGACEVTHTQTIETVKKVENTTPTREIEKQDEKKPRTKIPMSKLRRAVKKITEERKKYEEAERQKMSAQQRKSSIPRLKHTVVTATTSKEEARTASPRTDEEFDKLFEEIVVNQSADESPLIKDPEKLDSKFEELIHAYDENKIEPISIDRVKTRIPMLKRKSEHEIDMSKYSERRRNASLKKRGSVDSSTHNSLTTMNVKESKIQSQTIQKTFTQQRTKLQSETKTTQQQLSKIAVNNSQDNQEQISSSKVVKETTRSSDNNEDVNFENEESQFTHSENSEVSNESVNSTKHNENTKIFKKSSSIDNSRTTNFNNEETNTKTLHKTIQRTVSEQHTSSITSTNISSNISQTKEITTTEITNNNNGATIKAIITVERENSASEVPTITNESDKTINDSKTTQHVTNEESNQSSVNSNNMQNSINNQKLSNEVELVQKDTKDSLSDENTNVSVEICEIIHDSEDLKDKRNESDPNHIKEISETNIEVKESAEDSKSNIEEIAADNNIISIETKEKNANVNNEEMSKQDSISIVADNENMQEEKSESNIVPDVNEETNTHKSHIQEIATDNNIIPTKTIEDSKNMIDKEISNQDRISIVAGNADNQEEKSESNKDPEIKEEIKITIKQTDTSEEKESSTHVEYNKKIIINEKHNADSNETNDKDEDLKTKATQIRDVESNDVQEKEAKTSADSSNKSANYLDVSVSMVKQVVTQQKLNDKTNNNTQEHYLDIVNENNTIKEIEQPEIESITSLEYNVIPKEVVEGKKDEKSLEACTNINKIPESTSKQVSQNLPNTVPEKSDSTLTSVEESLGSKLNVGSKTFISNEEKRVIEKTVSREESFISENKIIESKSETKTQVTDVDEKPQNPINLCQDKDNTNLTDNNITRQVNITQNVNISSESSLINDSVMEKEFVSKAYEKETKTTLKTQNILQKKVTESETITTKIKEVLKKSNDSYDDLNVIQRESKGFNSDKSPINIDKTLIRPATPVIDISPTCIDGKEKEIIISNDNLSNKDVTEHYFKEASQTRVNNASNTTDSLDVNKERTEKIVLDKSMINELLKSDLQEEDIIILRGKVNRVMSRLDSINSKKTNIQQEIVDEVPKRTVLSKIAIFERKEVEEKPLYRRIPRSQSHGPSLRHKPKIVEEVLKTTSKMENNVNISRTGVYNKQHSHNLSRNLINNQKSEDIVNKLTSSQNNLDFEKDTNNSENIVISDDRKYSSLKSINKDELHYEDNSKTIKVSFKERDNKKEVSYAEIDLGDAVKGKVQNVVRMISMERMDLEKKGIIDIKEKPKRGTVLERIALFEKKSTPVTVESRNKPKDQSKTVSEEKMNEEELRLKIEELKGAKRKYGRYTDLKFVELNDGSKMPAIGLGTALLSKNLTKHIVSAAIDLGYRTIDTAYIYGNEKEIGEAINEKIKDGTVQREDLFVISKLWSTFHRKDLVEKACKMSLKSMGLDYFDLYMIHNPMSFKEGDDPLPKIANVIQYSDSDYLDAWYGVEHVIRKGLARRGGVSNFNSAQVDRIVDKGKLKPVVNQVECHPYLTQQRLDDFCQTRDVKLNCYGVLGSKGTPIEYKSGLTPVIDDPMVLVMAAGLNVTPAQLLISYQLHVGHSVIVKSSTGAHLWSNLLAQDVRLETSHIDALNAMNRNKRNFLFKGMGDTHRNYPFRIPF
ncbi:GRIP and coiled-coil domain-containing protein-like [Colias croceus]|uniref:GRIP and coiled-coil domain-containing protein-like n=1 Tax=Colias crocea TaxID=72248 RepID=UPI001E27BF30|nr:GRIP and coiled-coil domain-containing protein-like [Colias croceus]